MVSELRDGVLFLGCGRSARMHAAALAKADPTVPRFYADRDGSVARALSRRLAGSDWFDSCATALADPRASTVVITTPPATRFELTFAALAADRNVIVEPPAFPSASAFELVRGAARAAGRQVFVAASSAYRPLTRRLRRLVTHRTLGEIRLVHLNALRTVRTDATNGDAATRAAVFADRVRWLTFMSSIGLPVVVATGHHEDADDCTARPQVITLRYATGAIGLLCHLPDVASTPPVLRFSAVHGTEGTTMFDLDGRLVIESGPRRRLAFSRSDELRGRVAMYADFLAALRLGRTPAYTLGDAHRDTVLMEQSLAGMGSTPV